MIYYILKKTYNNFYNIIHSINKYVNFPKKIRFTLKFSRLFKSKYAVPFCIFFRYVLSVPKLNRLVWNYCDPVLSSCSQFATAFLRVGLKILEEVWSMISGKNDRWNKIVATKQIKTINLICVIYHATESAKEEVLDFYCGTIRPWHFIKAWSIGWFVAL